MSSDWPQVSTAWLIEHDMLSIGDGYRAKNSEMAGEGLPFARAANVDGGINLEGADLLAPQSVARAGQKVSRPGDSVFTSKGTVGRFGYVRPGRAPFVYSPQLCYWRPGKGLDSRFVFYWLRGAEASAQFAYLKAQTDMAAYVSLNDQRRMKITLPPIDEQRRIAGVLGALDDKIEHNGCLSARLADLAQTQFQAARAEWRTDSQAGKMGDLGEPTREVTVDDAAYIGLDNMPRGSTVLSEWLDDAPVENSVGFRRGDVLFGKLRPYFKKVGVAPIDGRCSTEILVLRPHHDYLWGPLVGNASSEAFISHCVQVSRGTKMPRSEWKDAAEFEVSIPQDEQAAELTREMRMLYDTAISLVHESRTLRSVRDALLPKLVSGATRVRDSYDLDDALGTVAEAAGVAAP